MSEEPPLPGWWQSPDGGWHPPEPATEPSVGADAPAEKAKPSKPLHKSFTAWFVILAATFIGVVTWIDSRADEGRDLSLAGFREEVSFGFSCSSLFEYRNELRREIPSTTDELNDELQFIGCLSPTSKRGDQSPPTPSTVCEGAYSDHRSVRLDYSVQWYSQSVDGDRRLLERLDNDFSRVWICDIDILGEYASPDSMSVRSVFVMPTLGVPPDEELPSDVAMWAEADAR